MLSTLNESAIEVLGAVKETAKTLKVGARWARKELQDSAEQAEEINAETRDMRVELGKGEVLLDLEKQKYKLAKAKAKFDAKLASSGLDIKSGNN